MSTTEEASGKLDLSTKVEEMFVQVAHGAVATEGSLTLTGLGPSTLYFADRPERVVGHMSNRMFVDGWTKGENSLQADPPNAVLAFLEAGAGMPDDAVMILRDPVLEGDSITYSIEMTEGRVPDKVGPCTLFIDPLGRPLSPVSVAGMHRRQERRR